MLCAVRVSLTKELCCSVWRERIFVSLCTVSKLLDMCIWASHKHGTESLSINKNVSVLTKEPDYSDVKWLPVHFALYFSSIQDIERFLRCQVHMSWSWASFFETKEFPICNDVSRLCLLDFLRVLFPGRECIHAANAVLQKFQFMVTILCFLLFWSHSFDESAN